MTKPPADIDPNVLTAALTGAIVAVGLSRRPPPPGPPPYAIRRPGRTAHRNE